MKVDKGSRREKRLIPGERWPFDGANEDSWPTAKAAEIHSGPI